MSDELYRYRSAPLTSAIVIDLLLDLLRSGQVQAFKRDAIAKIVQQVHLERGGAAGHQHVLPVVKKALKSLADRGLIENFAYGRWRPTSDLLISEQVIEPVVTAPVETSRLSAERTIGSGAEALYVYYYSNDRKLAELRGLDRWECKIGYTEGDVASRIYGQVSQTSSHTLPIVALVVLTTRARDLEQAVHAMLRYAERQVRPSVGSEWFSTTPDEVERLIACLDALAGTGPDPLSSVTAVVPPPIAE